MVGLGLLGFGGLGAAGLYAYTRKTDANEVKSPEETTEETTPPPLPDANEVKNPEETTEETTPPPLPASLLTVTTPTLLPASLPTEQEDKTIYPMILAKQAPVQDQFLKHLTDCIRENKLFSEDKIKREACERIFFNGSSTYKEIYEKYINETNQERKSELKSYIINFLKFKHKKLLNGDTYKNLKRKQKETDHKNLNSRLQMIKSLRSQIKKIESKKKTNKIKCVKFDLLHEKEDRRQQCELSLFGRTLAQMTEDKDYAALSKYYATLQFQTVHIDA